MSQTVFQLEDIKVVRSAKIILNVDKLRIDQGQFINIIGANGAGKSTLLKLICGLIKPTEGKIFFNNLQLDNISKWKRTNLKKQIGYIPQSAQYNAQLPFTVREIVAMGRTSAKSLFQRLNINDYKIVDKWIEKIGLAAQRNQIFSTLSGGEQQKVLIARAMVQNPKVLMLDEPTSNLDFHWKGKITKLVNDLQKTLKLTVIMISHELNSIPLKSDRTILLADGNIIDDGQSVQVLTSKKIQDVYKCKIKIYQENGNRYIINQEII